LQVKGKDGRRRPLRSAMKRYETIALPNSLTLEIWDNSRPIAADTWKVELIARIAVPFRPEYFPTRQQYDKLTSTLGQEGRYEYRQWRTFVRSEAQEATFQELLHFFKTHTEPYLAHKGFPARFSQAKLREVEETLVPLPFRAEG